uniref:Uncharacterized protein n=1 Tax=Fagus sylvatica TaxID=28930 RepID=A0A2N9J8B2_FAGSY
MISLFDRWRRHEQVQVRLRPMSLWHQSQSVSEAADGSGSAEEYVYTGWSCGDGGGRQGSEPRRTALSSLGRSSSTLNFPNFFLYNFMGMAWVQCTKTGPIEMLPCVNALDLLNAATYTNPGPVEMLPLTKTIQNWTHGRIPTGPMLLCTGPSRTLILCPLCLLSASTIFLILSPNEP